MVTAAGEAVLEVVLGKGTVLAFSTSQQPGERRAAAVIAIGTL